MLLIEADQRGDLVANCAMDGGWSRPWLSSMLVWSCGNSTGKSWNIELSHTALEHRAQPHSLLGREEGGERVLEVVDPGSIPISGGLEEGMSGLGLGDRDRDNGMLTLDWTWSDRG